MAEEQREGVPMRRGSAKPDAGSNADERHEGNMYIEDRIRHLEERVRALEGRMEDARETIRESVLVKLYGECVSKTDAADIMGVTRATVYTLLRNGRIKGAMGGRKVDVRSIARYIERTGGTKGGTGA